MASSLLTFIAIFAISLQVHADKAITGLWQFDSYRYQNVVSPRPNPDLELYFEFTEDGFNTLSWSRKGDIGFCERRAIYTTSQDILKQKVVWVHPDNRSDCGQDPDMQIGRESETHFEIRNGNLETEVQMGDDKLTYIWIPVSDSL